jgi:hypothetical protein
MTNPPQIDHGGAQNQERHPKEQTGSDSPEKTQQAGNRTSEETIRAFPDREPAKKKTGEF